MSRLAPESLLGMERSRLPLGLAATACALALVGGTVLFARAHAKEPARCADGMVTLGPRCCGEGQSLDEAGRCAGPPSRCASSLGVTPQGCVAVARVVRLAGGLLRVGPGDWEAQGVVAAHQATLAPYGLDAFEVDEARYAACVATGACAPVKVSGEPGRAISGLTFDEAARFCAFAGGALPTSDQLAFAAAGTASRRYAWGDTGAVCRRAAFGLREGPCAIGAIGPEIAGSHPDGASPEGLYDLAGNVAEWAAPRDPGAAWAEVRGGAFTDGAATALRSWQTRHVRRDERSDAVGFRCAYR